jgi:hypothetical protein
MGHDLRYDTLHGFFRRLADEMCPGRLYFWSLLLIAGDPMRFLADVTERILTSHR